MTAPSGDLAIERASPVDLFMLALGQRSPVPPHTGAALVLGPGADPDTVQRLIDDRVARVPRLRQRLVDAPLGCGRPIWVDDPDFGLTRHLRRLRCPAPAGERALLDVVAAVGTEPLPRDRPLWSAVLVTNLGGGRSALIVVLHHALADGLGGLAVLSRLVDGAAEAAGTRAFPSPAPTRARLAADALRGRLQAPRRLPERLRDLRASVAASGGLHPTPAARCSLLGRTGPLRRLAVARADLGALREATHRLGGTLNDALLTAVTAALATLLEQRGEAVTELRVAVPVAGRTADRAAELGNAVTPLLVTVPLGGTTPERLSRVAASLRAARTDAGGPPVIGAPGMRLLAARGLYGIFLRRQRRFHTVVSNLRGPSRPLSLAGARIVDLIPFSVGEAGNVTLHVVALSYAGTLTVTVVADPDRVPDLPTLTAALQSELDRLAEPA